MGISRKSYETGTIPSESLRMKQVHSASLNHKLVNNRKRIQEGLTGDAPQPDQKIELKEVKQDIAPPILKVSTTQETRLD